MVSGAFSVLFWCFYCIGSSSILYSFKKFKSRLEIAATDLSISLHDEKNYSWMDILQHFTHECCRFRTKKSHLNENISAIRFVYIFLFLVKLINDKLASKSKPIESLIATRKAESAAIWKPFQFIYFFFEQEFLFILYKFMGIGQFRGNQNISQWNPLEICLIMERSA